MPKQKYRQYRYVVVLALVLSLGLVGTAVAAQSSSTNYSVNEVQIGGAGSSLKDCSMNYCAKSSLGDTVAGRGSSANYSAQFGANTTNEPLLEVIVEGGTQDMGVLDTDRTGTAVSAIKVRNYLSSGYGIFITGTAPSQGTHALKTMDDQCPCTSQQGAEQFGINMSNNTSPDIGGAAVQVPSSAFSFGAVDDDYSTPDLFKYHDGAEVAHSSRSTGETDYTLSMIINVSNVTPGGRYNGVYSAVVVATF